VADIVIAHPEGERRYPIPETFTYREIGTIKRVSGIRAGELEAALAAGDVDVIVALAVICATRAGETVTAADFENLDFGAIGIEGEDEDPTPAAAEDGGEPQTTSDSLGLPA
jgi:hypothetical protein